MRRTPARSTIFAIVALIAIVGCGGDDNPVKPQPQQPKYLPSSTPQNTLANMALAYTNRDSTGYDSLFDAAYSGTSYDPNTMLGIPFTKTDETRHIAALAKSTTAAVFLTIPPAQVRTRDAGDPPGWATITIQNFEVSIIDGPTTYTTPADETMEFKFAPTAPSAGSPTDTTWHIARWVELPGSGPNP